MSRYCSRCGQQSQHEAIYCVGCGSILTTPVPHQPPLPHPPMPQPGFTPHPPVFGTTIPLNTAVYERREASFPAHSVKTVRVSCKMLNIEIVTVDSDKILVEWDETASWSLSSEDRDDCLELKEQNTLGFHNFSDFFSPEQHRNVRIALPTDYNGNLFVENETGVISAIGIITKGRIELKTTVGHITARTVVANGGFRTEAHAGGMDISNIESKGEFIAAGSIGQIALDSVRSNKIDVEVSASAFICCRKVFAETAITISAKTGDIRCSVDDNATNYSVFCESTHGVCNLANKTGSGPKALHASTSIGNIDIQFKSLLAHC